MSNSSIKELNETIILVKVGPSLWQAFDKRTGEAISPQYNNRDAVIYFVNLQLKQQMEEEIDKMLGGNSDITSIHDDSPLCGGLSDAVPGNGTEEKF